MTASKYKVRIFSRQRNADPTAEPRAEQEPLHPKSDSRAARRFFRAWRL